MLRSETNQIAASAAADMIARLCDAHADAVACRSTAERQAALVAWSDSDRAQWARALVSLRTAEQHLSFALEHLADLAALETYSQDWGV